MKIIGTHDELTLLRLKCDKNAHCNHCVMFDFCRSENTDIDESVYLVKTLYNKMKKVIVIVFLILIIILYKGGFRNLTKI